MADVHIVCMRDAAATAESLADLIEASGRTIEGPPNDLDADGAGIIIWSEAAREADGFIAACRRLTEHTIVVRACADPLPSPLAAYATFDLTTWRGDPHDPVAKRVVTAVGRLAPKEDDVLAQVRFWRIVDQNRRADLEAYLTRFGADGYFADLARLRLERLQRQSPVSRPAPKAASADAGDEWSVWRPLGFMTAISAAAAAAAAVFYFGAAEVAPPAFATPVVEFASSPATVATAPLVETPSARAPAQTPAPTLAMAHFTPVSSEYGSLEPLPPLEISDLAPLHSPGETISTR